MHIDFSPKFKAKYGRYDLTKDVISELNELIAKEQEQEKPLSDDEKRRQAQLEQIAKLKAQGKFNLNSTKSQREKEREL
ncbi:hypothetical protein CIG11343_0785 [Campylobacter iguaniorum]|uniref:hypothetical protein n=1 Tax=Campylobacter iguaniorum TaxID=1244531 RepID=UPI0007C8EA11|nr:hypothetical protein [Campylobacter iguaniorum]ANE35825.1 hypothetical protein CIG11343_0785 [Campylobacter iguaniorum]